MQIVILNSILFSRAVVILTAMLTGVNGDVYVNFATSYWSQKS